jgi:hypothetical protein
MDETTAPIAEVLFGRLERRRARQRVSITAVFCLRILVSEVFEEFGPFYGLAD